LESRLALILAVSLLGGGCRALPETPLARAAAAGDAGEVRARLAAGDDATVTDGRGWQPLHHAARGGHVAVIRLLAAAGAPLDTPDRANAWTPLQHAVHKSQPDAVRALLDAGADPNARAAGSATPLMMAAGYGQTPIVRELLARGADPRAEADGVTALWAAAGGGAIADITDGPRLGTCFPDTIRALRDAAPDVQLRPGLATRAVVWLARSPECSRLVPTLVAVR
jgi:ankyrin repeat protein